MKNQKVFVMGHKNPDTDSICSAIAYSYLLNATNKYNAIPVRLGEINRETEYVLKRFGVEHPVLLKTVKQKVEDLKVESLDDLFEDDEDVKKESLAQNVDKIEEKIPVKVGTNVTSLEDFGDEAPVLPQDDEYDLQKELEAKFDELFGPIDE